MGTPTGTFGTFGNFGRKNQIFSLQGVTKTLPDLMFLSTSVSVLCQISGELFNKAPGWHYVTSWSFGQRQNPPKKKKTNIYIYIYDIYIYDIYIYIQFCDKSAHVWGPIQTPAWALSICSWSSRIMNPSKLFFSGPSHPKEPAGHRVGNHQGSHVVQKV